MIEYDKAFLVIQGDHLEIHPHETPDYRWCKNQYYLGFILYDRKKKNVFFRGANIIPTGIPKLKEFNKTFTTIKIYGTNN